MFNKQGILKPFKIFTQGHKTLQHNRLPPVLKRLPCVPNVFLGLVESEISGEFRFPRVVSTTHVKEDVNQE